MFFPLDEKSVIEYLGNNIRSFPTLADPDYLEVRQVKEGNVNLIFRVNQIGDERRSVIIKQALPYAWRYPDFKMPQRRAFLETVLLKTYCSFYPGIAPKIYFFDRKMYLNVMEDLYGHDIMRNGLKEQRYYLGFEKPLGIFIARNLFFTSDLYLPIEKLERYRSRFLNPVMSKVTLDLVFKEPLSESPNNRWEKGLGKRIKEIREDKKIMLESSMLERSFCKDKKTLLHGDLHTGSVMAKNGDVKVIDPEFALYGPYGFDIGSMLANLIMSHITQEYFAKSKKVKSSYRKWLIDAIKGLYEYFMQELDRLILQNRPKNFDTEIKSLDFKKKLLADTLGFLSLEIIRRVIGLASIIDFTDIEDKDARISLKEQALNLAADILKGRHGYATIGEALKVLDQ